eukprot:TRINITY_DN66632_c2_g2_i1.p1 TRINITY_DN66632_c2_g2~~TRINITY_DN66632_c2_g2_i1.p1  ORF type:complete len:196 (+),score=1.32 TRINITY_DN66632_c2_g2_i1:41-628(+)
MLTPSSGSTAIWPQLIGKHVQKEILMSNCNVKKTPAASLPPQPIPDHEDEVRTFSDGRWLQTHPTVYYGGEAPTLPPDPLPDTMSEAIPGPFDSCSPFNRRTFSQQRPLNFAIFPDGDPDDEMEDTLEPTNLLLPGRISAVSTPASQFKPQLPPGRRDSGKHGSSSSSSSVSSVCLPALVQGPVNVFAFPSAHHL